MVPTLCRTLGVKGHRPVVGSWDCKHLLYVFASVNVTTAQLHTDTVECPAGLRRRTGQSKTRRLQLAFADHLRKARGIRVGTSALQAFCRRRDIRPYRPTDRFLRGDPAKQAAARDDLAALKKGRRPVNSSC